jgi:hypothetical protein
MNQFGKVALIFKGIFVLIVEQMHFGGLSKSEVLFVVVAVQIDWFLVLEQSGDHVQMVDQIQDNGLQLESLEFAHCWQKFGQTQEIVTQFGVKCR